MTLRTSAGTKSNVKKIDTDEIIISLKTTHTEIRLDEDQSEMQNVQNDVKEERQEKNENNENPPRRGPGRPRIIRTGLRGRPEKQYHRAKLIENSESAYLAEIPISQALQGPNAEE